MKRNGALFALSAFALLATMLVGSCSLFGRSADDTISQFEGFVKNHDLGSIYTLCDSSAQLYNQAKTSTYWENYFHAAESFTFSLSVSDSGASGTIQSSTTYPSGTPISIVLTKDGTDYAISSITITGAGGLPGNFFY